MPPLKITVATVCYNAGTLIERTIDSVTAQDYPNVEHLIIDGNSHDDTLSHIHRYQECNSNAAVPHEIVCVSEPDKGLYDAMNKAIDLATGDYILFLNAGDRFHSDTLLSQVAAAVNSWFEASGDTDAHLPAVLYGDTHLVDAQGNFVRRRRLTPPERLTWHSFHNGMLVCHQAFFARTDLARLCHYDLRYRFSADFDWCIRILKEAARRRAGIVNLHTVVADYLQEGLTTRHHKASLRERFCIMARHYGPVTTLLRHAWFAVRSVTKR